MNGLICKSILLLAAAGCCGSAQQFKTATVLLPGHKKPTTIRYIVQNGKALFQGDIDLGTESELLKPSTGFVYSSRTRSGFGQNQSELSVKSGDFLWPGNIVPYVIDGGVPEGLRQNILDAIDEWNGNTNLLFRAFETGDRDRVQFVKDNGIPGSGQSRIGRVTGLQNIRLRETAPLDTVIHEMGHAVGLYHEQSRMDRDGFVEVLWENIRPGLEGNFDKHVDSIDEGPYDFTSVMHYSATSFGRRDPSTGQILPTLRSKVPGQSINPQDRLSQGDIRALARIYPTRVCDERVPVLFQHTNLSGTAVSLESSIPDLHARRLGDSASSVCVPLGWDVTLFWDAGYEGRSLRLTGPRVISDLARPPDGGNWGDGISSVLVSGAQANPAPLECSTQPIVFEHDHYRGRRLALSSDAPRLHQSSQALGDQLSSVCVPANWTVRFFEHSDYGGRYLQITGPINLPDLARQSPDGSNWGDIISSADVTGPANTGVPVSCSSFPFLFEDDNYRGRAFPLEWQARDLHQHDFGDKASSLCVPLGWRAELFVHSDFTGEVLTRFGPAQIADLHAMGWGDRISSFRVTDPSGSSGIQCSRPLLFEHDSFRGSSFEIVRTLQDLHAPGFGDRASSVCVPAGWSVTLFVDSNLSGRSLSVQGFGLIGDLKRTAPDGQDWGDRISSVSVIPPPGTPPTFPCTSPTLYVDDHYQNRSLPITASISDLRQHQFGDAASSVCVPAGFAITVYEHSNFSGDRLRVQGPTEIFDLARDRPGGQNWGDRISSVRLE